MSGEPVASVGFLRGLSVHSVFSPSYFKAGSQASPPPSPYPLTSIPLTSTTYAALFPGRAASDQCSPLSPSSSPPPSTATRTLSITPGPSKTRWAGAGKLGPRWTVCGPGVTQGACLCVVATRSSLLSVCTWMCASMALRVLDTSAHPGGPHPRVWTQRTCANTRGGAKCSPAPQSPTPGLSWTIRHRHGGTAPTGNLRE